MAKIQDVVEARGAEVRNSYEQLLIGMQGAWLSFTYVMENPMAARIQLRAQLIGLVNAYSSLLAGKVREAVTDAHNQAVMEAAVGYMGEPPAQLLEEAAQGIELASRRDARGLEILAGQTLTRYALARRRMPAATARVAALGELPSQGRDVFVQLDRLQRKRNSADFVVASARMAMFATYFHSFTTQVAEAGEEVVVAVHPEHGSVELNLLAGYTEWAAENTHPNTRWHLQRKAVA